MRACVGTVCCCPSPNTGLSNAPTYWPQFNSTALMNMQLSWPLAANANLETTVRGHGSKCVSGVPPDLGATLCLQVCDFWDKTLSSFQS